ncbi:MAG: TRAP transporter large permease subunit [Eubacteriales bacterium]|nr:TRAP transporter large permease subunit [Eubacteriales bacterium]
MTMMTHSLIVIAVIVIAFVITKKYKLETEISMIVASVAAILAHIIVPMGVDPRSDLPFTEIVRHLVEGATTYFDVCLIFLTATFFMSLFNESGGVAFIVRKIVRKFHAHRMICLLLLTIIMMIPGAITGSGATTVLTVGGLVGAVLKAMGVNKDKRIALIFILGAMSAACPPINLWAMMAAAGANMPYVGFTLPLLIVSVTGALFASYYLAGKGQKILLDDALADLPEAPEGWNFTKALTPFLVLIVLILAGRYFPFTMPTLGLPFVFMVSAFILYFIAPKKVNIMQTAMKTVENLKGLVGIMVAVGILNQTMTLTGARGLLSLGVVKLPIVVLFSTLWLILPISEGVLQYAVAPLFGVPLIMLFNMLGYDPVISLAAWSVMWPLGDCLPPTAVVGRAAVLELDYKGDYYKGFVKSALVPMLFILLLSSLMMIFSKEIGAWL